jgi:filamentous hemagglutinin
LALTGRRYLSGSTDTETEYRVLMNAGIAYAKAYQLTPGVALSAEQMALLTTDIVWLTVQSVTLADGSTTRVLVPQVYLRRPEAGDLGTGGALIAGSRIDIKTPGELINSGSLQGESISASAGDLTNSGRIAAERSVLLSATRDLKNLSGRIGASQGNVSLTAGRDIVLQTRTLETRLEAASEGGTSRSTRTQADRIASMQAGGDLLLSAGRDLTVQGATLGAGQNLDAYAGRDLTVSAVEGRYEFTSRDGSGTRTQGRTAYLSEAATTQQSSTLTAGRNVTLVAGTNPSQTADDPKTPSGTLKLDGSHVSAGRDIALQGNNVSISTARASQSLDNQTVQDRSFARAATSNETLVGGTVTAGRNLSVSATGGGVAGYGDLTLQGATLKAANGTVSLSATRDLFVFDATTTQSSTNESYLLDKGVVTSTDTTRALQRESTRSTGSVVSGALVALVAGRDLGVLGSQVSGDDGVLVSAGRNLAILEARQTTTETRHSDVHTTGLAASFTGVPLPGSKSDANDTTHGASSVSASSITSAQGSVRIQANAATLLRGVQVSAAQDIAVQGSDVSITGATAIQTTTVAHNTHGTEIGMTGWHDLGKGIDAHLAETDLPRLFRAIHLQRTPLTEGETSLHEVVRSSQLSGDVGLLVSAV